MAVEPAAGRRSARHLAILGPAAAARRGRVWISRPGRCRTCGPGGPISVRLDDLDIICAVLGCEPGDLLIRDPAAAKPGRPQAPAGRAGRGPGDPAVPARRPLAAAGMTAPWPAATCTACGTTGPGRAKARSVQALLCPRPAPSAAVRWLRAGPAGTWQRGCAPAATGCRGPGWSSARTAASERPVWFADRCERCKRRAAAKSGACRDCGKQVTRLWSGRCRSCDAKSREVTGACRDCGDLTRLTSGLCRACRLFRWAHPAGTCPWCGRQQPIGAAGACRSCQLAARAAWAPPQAGPGTPAPGRASPRNADPRDHRGLRRLRGPGQAFRRTV